MNLRKQQALVRMLLSWGPSVLIGILIFYVSHIPGNEITTSKSISNLKPSVIYHIIIFTMLGFSLCHATKANSLKVFAGILSFCLVYAIFDEVHQIFVPGRFPSVLDVITDLVGATSAISIWKLLIYKRIYT